MGQGHFKKYITRLRLKWGLTKKLGKSNMGEGKICIQDLVKHPIWNFLRKQLMSQSP